jgi:tetratricopeptide (TPR) repeat protein
MSDRDELLSLAEQAQPQLTGPDQAAWLVRLEDARPRFNGLLQRCLDEGDDQTGLRLCAALGRYWWMCGQPSEGLRWIEGFLSRPSSDVELRRKAVESAAGLAYARADYDEASRWLAVALEFWSSRDDLAVARLTNQLGMVRREQARFDEATALHEQALALYRASGDAWGEAAALNNLGVVRMFVGDFQRSTELHERALLLRRCINDDRGVASSLGNLGNVARLQGDAENAWRLHNEALTIRRFLNDRWGVAGSLVCLGAVAAMRGDFAEAHGLIDESEAGFRAVDDKLGLCEVIDARALLASAEGRREEARHLFDQAEAMREKLGAPLPPAFHALVERARNSTKKGV